MYDIYTAVGKGTAVSILGCIFGRQIHAESQGAGDGAILVRVWSCIEALGCRGTLIYQVCWNR